MRLRERIREAFENIVETVKDAVVNVVNDIKEAVKGVIDQVSNGIKAILNTTVALANAIASGNIKDIGKQLLQLATEVADLASAPAAGFEELALKIVKDTVTLAAKSLGIPSDLVNRIENVIGAAQTFADLATPAGALGEFAQTITGNPSQAKQALETLRQAFKPLDTDQDEQTSAAEEETGSGSTGGAADSGTSVTGTDRFSVTSNGGQSSGGSNNDDDDDDEKKKNGTTTI